ncbi:MAG: endonuclease VIII [Bacteroidota bacterium]|nr:endonuclease VIII [Bacteroidota bacterium]
MIELPEAITLGRQINETLAGLTITGVFNATSLNKFAFFNGDPTAYKALLTGRKLVSAKGMGIFVDIHLDEEVLLSVCDGVKLYYGDRSATVPAKYQLLLTFSDDSFLAFSIAMYGGIYACKGEFTNSYHAKSFGRVSPLSPEFDESYFKACITGEKKDLTLKAFLATEQRFPGIGNGVLQDILFQASLHPKRKLSSLSETDKEHLFQSVRQTLTDMTDRKGRDTETDLFGNKGGYATLLSKNTVTQPCPNCKGSIRKENYMGGAIYYCPSCQPI